MWTYYLHWVTIILITSADYYNKLEPVVNAFEKKVGLYTEPDTTDYETPPFYIPPIEQDSTWILPPIEPIKSDSSMAKK
jgi:hypothetical protein